MRKFAFRLLSAAAIAAGAAATLAATAGSADARTRFFLGIGLPPLFVGPPAYYYPPPPPPPAYYYPPPAYSAPPAYYAPPPCHPRYDWRWNGYRWVRAYVGCY
ncbi:MAG: hypothetical protein KIT16_03950 [Rhodospirillaceae bacterium]|nr:hypothetical protein [Rhodospirillaceae bacterium]